MTSQIIVQRRRPKMLLNRLDVTLKPEFVDAMWKILVKIKGERGAVVEFTRVMQVHPEVILQEICRRQKVLLSRMTQKLRPSQFADRILEKAGQRCRGAQSKAHHARCNG